MQCVVTNYGRPRAFPTRVGNIFLSRFVPLEVCDEGVLDDLKHFEQSDLLGFEVLEPSRPEAPELLSQGVDYSGYRINELRAIAAGKGIKGAFSMKKVDLIKEIEEEEIFGFF